MKITVNLEHVSREVRYQGKITASKFCNMITDSLLSEYIWFSLADKLHVWNGVYFERINKGDIKENCTETPNVNGFDYAKLLNPEEEEESDFPDDEFNNASELEVAIKDCYNESTHTYTTNNKNEIINQMKDFSRISGKSINNMKGRFIPFINGYYHIKKKNFQDSRDPLVTELYARMRSIYCIPHRYNPDATYEPFKETLDLIFSYNGIINIRHRDIFMIYFAYCLTDSILLQKILLLYGEGSNGKSFLISIIKKVLGEDLTCSVAPQDGADRFNKIAFHGKLANLPDDIPKTALTSKVESELKKRSGSEYLRGEFKGVNAIDFRNTCKEIETCNCVPDAPTGAGFAFYRRYIVLPLLYIFTEINIDTDAMIRIFKESSIEGIINYALSFLPRLEELRLFAADEAEINWRKYGNSITSFLYFHTREEENREMPIRDVFQIYTRYCKVNHLKAFSNIQFGKATSKQGISKSKERASLYDIIRRKFNGMTDNPIWHCMNFELHFTKDEAYKLGVIRTPRGTWRIKEEDEAWYYSDEPENVSYFRGFTDFKPSTDEELAEDLDDSE